MLNASSKSGTSGRLKEFTRADGCQVPHAFLCGSLSANVASHHEMRSLTQAGNTPDMCTCHSVFCRHGYSSNAKNDTSGKEISPASSSGPRIRYYSATCMEGHEAKTRSAESQRFYAEEDQIPGGFTSGGKLLPHWQDRQDKNELRIFPQCPSPLIVYLPIAYLSPRLSSSTSYDHLFPAY